MLLLFRKRPRTVSPNAITPRLVALSPKRMHELSPKKLSFPSPLKKTKIVNLRSLRVAKRLAMNKYSVPPDTTAAEMYDIYIYIYI